MLHHNQRALLWSSRRLPPEPDTAAGSSDCGPLQARGVRGSGRVWTAWRISCQNFAPASWATEVQRLPFVVVVRVDMAADKQFRRAAPEVVPVASSMLV